MDLTRKIDLVGYLHIGYGMALVLIAAVIVFILSLGAIVLPSLASWAVGMGASATSAFILAAVGLPSMVAGVLLIRRNAWARGLVIILSVLDLFSFPVGTALGAFSLWILLKERARLEFA